MSTVFLGLGSNLGDRLANITAALNCLREVEGIAIDKVSSFYETEPQDAPGPKYLNGVIKVITDLSPKEVLFATQAIEKRLGRERPFKNAPRTIDLDILLYGDKEIRDDDLTVPHPRMFKRKFVMKPLLEIEPGIDRIIKGLKLNQ